MPPLRDPLTHNPRFGDNPLIGDGGGAAAQECRESMHKIGMEVEGKEFLQEYSVINSIKGFGEIH